VEQIQKERELTDKERSFINEYMVDGNATQAYIRSKYAANYPKIAQPLSAQLLSKPIIQVEIANRREKEAEKYEISRERVLKEEKSIAFADPALLFELMDGTQLHPKDIPEQLRRAISGIDVV